MRYTLDEVLMGGNLAIFRSIGCIGDSLSSGEFEYDNHGEKGFWDCYEYSWGKYIERMTGVPVTNFSKGGMTAYELYTSAEAGSSVVPDVNRLFQADNLKQAYFIALGVNDLNHLEEYYPDGVGAPETDICRAEYTKNAGSFVGWYAKIIQRLQALQPEAKFFLLTMPKNTDGEEGQKEERFAALIHRIADALPNCYVVDLYRDAPVYDEEFRRRYHYGHMNAMGYLITARLVLKCTDRIIRENPMAFRLVQFIGTENRPTAEALAVGKEASAES